MEALIKIDKPFIDYFRISYYCPSCHKQVILTPDIGDKEYFSCGRCQHSIHVHSTQFHHIQHIKSLMDNMEQSRKILEGTGYQVWIEGQLDTSTFDYGSTVLKRTHYQPFWEKDNKKQKD